MKIKEYRESGQRHTAPLLAFLYFLIFSFISSTNAFYIYFLKKDIVVQIQIKAEKDFDKGTTMLLSALLLSDEDSNKITTKAALVKMELDIAVRNLYDQIINPLNPGLGKKAKEHLSEVERILGFKITKLRLLSAGSSIDQYKVFADNLVQLIDKKFTTKYMVGTPDNLDAFKKDILQRRAIYKNSIIKEEFNRDIMDSMARDLALLQIKAEHLINFKKQVPVIDTTSAGIASFNYTWTNMFDGKNNSEIILSVFWSLILNMFAPVLALLFFRRK